MSAELLERYRLDALVALGNADFSSALTKVRQIELILATTPDFTRGSVSNTWKTTIAELRRSINQARFAAAGVQRAPIEFVAPELCE